MTFVNLHSHDTFSMLDGYGHPVSFARRAADLGMPALAQTNHGNMFGAFKHYRACKEAGIKPIIGCELYIAPGKLDDKSIHRWGEIEEDGKSKVVPRGYTHLTVLAQNATGVRNLFKLQSIGYLEGFYYYPRVDKETLAEYGDGLIVLSGCPGSEISTRLRLDQVDKAKETATFFAKHFPGRFFIELMRSGLEFEEVLNIQLVSLATALGLDVVATLDCHYPAPEDAHAHDAMLCLQTATTLDDPNRFKFSTDEFYLKTPDEVKEIWSDLPEAVSNTLKIADMVEDYDDVFEHRNLMPTDEGDLATEAYHGLVDRLTDDDFEHIDVYRARLAYELEIIEAKGYAGYFLVLSDIICWAKGQGILVGPGRGSGGGSLVAYAVGITDLDPIKYNLLFERFLNPEREAPPDIDVDIQASRRDEVLDYAVERYGPEYTANIMTLGMIKTKNAVKDAARVLGRTAKEGQQLTNLVPPPRRGRMVTLAEVPEIGEADQEVYDLALALEGQIRQTGVHAGGLVVSPEPLADIMPIKKVDKDPRVVAGFEQDEIEALGAVKYDLLGLTNLDVIDQTLKFINRRNDG